VAHARIPLRSSRCSGRLLTTFGPASRHWRFKRGWWVQHGLEFEWRFNEFVEFDPELFGQFLIEFFIFFFGKFRKLELLEQFVSQFQFIIRRLVWRRK
jgi:hypothetical protein